MIRKTDAKRCYWSPLDLFTAYYSAYKYKANL